MKFVILYGLFLAKTFTIMLLFIILLLIIYNFRIRIKSNKEDMCIYNLGKQYRNRQRQMQLSCMTNTEKYIWQKRYNKEDKIAEKKDKYSAKNKTVLSNRSCIYVLDFVGGINAKEVNTLRQEITAILSVAKKGDEVILRLESAGGVVNGYGLAAAQLQRIKEKNIPLTITVDKIAASGGYLMACVADKIVVAPFSIIGSIGVIAQIPNFNRFLKHNNIDIELHTAGTYKKTLTLFGENSSEGRSKFQEELNNTHKIFKEFVHRMRPMLNIDSVSTGEHWYGEQALKLGLVDAIGMSDDILIEKFLLYEVINIRCKQKKNWINRITGN